LSLLQNFLCAIFQFQCPNCSLLGDVSLHLDFRILFPASHVVWHIKDNLILQEGVHLFLYWVWLTWRNKSSCVVNAGHLVKVLVLTCMAAHDIKLSIEYVLSVSPILHAIINDQL